MPEERPSRLKVVLNTWLLLHINAQGSLTRTLGGLPNDFLTRAAASLLILDSAICDEGGLETESAMPWVSSHIFKALQAEGLLEPKPLRSYYSPTALARLDDSGLMAWARQAMREELARINSGDISTRELALPSTLKWLNSVMFAGIDMPDALHYDYQENHFSNLSLSALQITGVVAPHLSETAQVEEHATKAARLLSALSIAVPDFQLLPPISSPSARAALRQNIYQEKRMMYRYVYGDMPHAEYEQYRSSKEFKKRDSIVDSPERFHEADNNMDVLLRVRAQTASIRPHAQRLILEVVNGSRALDDVKKELETVRTFVEEAITRERDVRALQVIAGGELLMGAAEALAAIQLKEPSGVFPVTLAFGHAAHNWREANSAKGQRATLGRKFPLAWIAGVYKKEKVRSASAKRK